MPEALLRALVDTNVWISAFLNPGGAPGQVLTAFLAGRFVPVVSAPLLNEIRDVMARPRIRRRCVLGPSALDVILVNLQELGISVIPGGDLRMCRDPKDDFLLETALLGAAQYAVSRDDDLKRDLTLIGYLRASGIEVVSVAQFLEVLDRG